MSHCNIKDYYIKTVNKKRQYIGGIRAMDLYENKNGTIISITNARKFIKAKTGETWYFHFKSKFSAYYISKCGTKVARISNHWSGIGKCGWIQGNWWTFDEAGMELIANAKRSYKWKLGITTFDAFEKRKIVFDDVKNN